MIGLFPPLYEDELIYSWFARYMTYSGYTSTADAYVDLYGQKSISPSALFINNMPSETLSLLSKHKPLKQLILHHTMFPEYARFMDPVKRERLLEECDLTKGNWNNRVLYSASDNERRLRYCPECVKQDRESYGETYWHRGHQISNIRICTKHKTYLLDSSVVIKWHNTRLKNAEIVITSENNSEVCDDDTVISLAQYMERVFYSDRYSNEKIGQFLNDNISEGFRHNNGDRRLYAFYEEYKAFYSSVNEDLMKIDHMGKLFRGGKGSFYYICQLGLFEGIEAKDLLESRTGSDDERIFRIVAERLNEPIEEVEKIGTAVLDEYKKFGGKMIRRARCHKTLEEDDIRLLKDVKDTVAEMYGQGNKRPGKVSVKAVARSLGIDSKKLQKMKHCMEEIDCYHETQEHYWAREIIWAVERIRESDEMVTFTRISRMINIRREKLLGSMQELKAQDEAVYRMVYDVL